MLASIVLLNMLIAMMAETYETMRTEAAAKWKLLRAVQVLSAEKSVLRYVVEWRHGKCLSDIRPPHHVHVALKDGRGNDLKDENGNVVTTWLMQVENRTRIRSDQCDE